MTGAVAMPSLPEGWQATVQRAAAAYGTPLFIYFPAIMDTQIALLRMMLPERTELLYSVKANPNPWIISYFADRLTGIEVASRGEMAVAMQAGVSPKRFILVGPAKTDDELAAAAAVGLRAIVVESATEVIRLARMASRDAPVPVVLRLNLGRSCARLSMSGDTQFGMSPAIAAEVLRGASAVPSVQIIGLHTYAGTQRFSPHDVAATCVALLEMAAGFQEATSVRLSFLDFGGGFGTAVRKGDALADWAPLKMLLAPALTAYCKRHPWTTTFAFESGRFLMAPAGVLVTTVQDVKGNFDRQYVMLDGGIEQFGFDDRYLGQRPPAVAALTAGAGQMVPVILCGPLCTPADRIAADVLIAQPQRGDRLCIFNAGAYGLTANPGLFLGRGFAAEAVAMAGGTTLIRRRFAADEFAAMTVPSEVLQER